MGFLWHSLIGDHPQEELAKFGYILETKVKFFIKNPAICWGLLKPIVFLKMAISENFPLGKSGDFHAFFSQKSFVWVALDFIYFFLMGFPSDKISLPLNKKYNFKNNYNSKIKNLKT